MYAQVIVVVLLLMFFARALWLMASYKTPFLRTLFWSLASDVVASIPTAVLVVAAVVTSGWLHVVYQQAGDMEKMGMIGLVILAFSFCMYRLSPYLHKKVLCAGLGIRQEPAKNKKWGRAKAWLLGLSLALLLLYIVALARDIKQTSDPDYQMPTFNWEAHGHKPPPDPDPPLPEDTTQYKNVSAPLPPDIVEAAKKGDPVAQYKAGMHFLNSVSAADNQEEGMTLLTQSAQQGYAPAQYNLGYRIVARADAAGDGMAWLEKSAEKNYFAAQLFLARLYALGVGRPVDMATARRWLARARSSAAAVQPDDGDKDLFFDNGYYSSARRAAVVEKHFQDWFAGVKDEEQGGKNP